MSNCVTQLWFGGHLGATLGKMARTDINKNRLVAVTVGRKMALSEQHCARWSSLVKAFLQCNGDPQSIWHHCARWPASHLSDHDFDLHPVGQTVITLLGRLHLRGPLTWTGAIIAKRASRLKCCDLGCETEGRWSKLDAWTHMC
jgi:hypothetical protein